MESRLLKMILSGSFNARVNILAEGTFCEYIKHCDIWGRNKILVMILFRVFLHTTLLSLNNESLNCHITGWFRNISRHFRGARFKIFSNHGKAIFEFLRKKYDTRHARWEKYAVSAKTFTMLYLISLNRINSHFNILYLEAYYGLPVTKWIFFYLLNLTSATSASEFCERIR